MGKRRPSKFFKIILTVEIDPDHHGYADPDPYWIGKDAEKAIDHNTDMTAWIISVEPTERRA